MIKELLYLLLIGHLLGDFYFQSDSLVIKKKKSLFFLLIHIFIYFLSLCFTTFPFLDFYLLKWIFIIALTHFFIDYFKSFKLNNISETKLYVVDQFMHICIIFSVVLVIDVSEYVLSYNYIFRLIIMTYSLNFIFILSWILIVLLILLPTSITIKLILKRYEPLNKGKRNDKTVPNAGSLIGILERIFILLMLAKDQYSAIGFVLTAKSIARYKKITDNPKFSEYYLLGTLLSSIIVILFYYMIF